MSNHQLQNWISRKYLQKEVIEALAKKMQQRPFVKALYLDGFLRPEIAQELKEEFLKNPQREFHFNEVYQKSSKTMNERAGVDFYFYASDTLHELQKFLHSPIFLSYISFFYGKGISYEHIDLPYTSTQEHSDQEQKSQYEEWFQVQHFTQQGMTLQDNSFVEDLGWHTDYETDSGVVKAGNLILYLTTDETYSPLCWWQLELGKIEKKNIISYESISPDFNRLVLLQAEKQKSFHRIWDFVTSFQRRAFVKQLFYKD